MEKFLIYRNGNELVKSYDVYKHALKAFNRLCLKSSDYLELWYEKDNRRSLMFYFN